MTEPWAKYNESGYLLDQSDDPVIMRRVRIGLQDIPQDTALAFHTRVDQPR